MAIVDLIGYAAGFFLMISFLPQVVRTMRTRKAEDISLVLLSFTLCAGLLYEVYAFLLGLVPVVVMNGVFTLLVVWQLVLTVRYRLPSR